MTPIHFWYISESLKSSTPLVIGFIAAYVAYRQWHTGNQRLKLDLFERRLKVYEAAKKLVDNTLRRFEISENDLRAFNRDLSEAEFLFPLAIAQYLRAVAKMSLDLRSNTKALQAAIEQGDRAASERLNEKQSELIKKITDADQTFLIVLHKYLSFESVR
jgi:hypothetical protein